MSRASRLANSMPSILLRSPLHRLMSGNTLLVSFNGRRSGKRYTTPVAYLQLGPDEVISTTDGRWWRNLDGGAPVIVRIAGKTRPGKAEAVTDAEAALELLSALVAHQPSYARLARLPNGPEGPDLTKAIADGRVGIRIHLDPIEQHFASKGQ
jgi:deazaflavin-dependent oxidoreductase (nitroreductase family)